MDDIEDLRRMLDEPPPTTRQREVVRQALRTAYESPRQQRWRPSGRLGLAAAIGTTAVLLLTVLRVGPAEAWSPVPMSPPEALLLASLPSQCAHSDSESQQPILVDQRHDAAVALFGDRSSDDGTSSFRTCTLARIDGTWREADADDLGFSILVTAGSVDEEILGAPVDRVEIETAGQRIEVSYEGGFYLMWWPKDLTLTGEVMRFLATDGSVLLEIPVSVSVGT